MSQLISNLDLCSWGNRKNLGNEIYNLTIHALYAQALLHIASRMETENPSLQALLLRLQLLVHDAEVVLNELDYFRAQDELGGKNSAVDVPPKGFIHRLHFHACDMVRAVTAKLKPYSSSHDTVKLIEKLASVDMSSASCVGNEGQVQAVKTSNPKFNRAILSKKITDITEKLKALCDMVKTLI